MREYCASVDATNRVPPLSGVTGHPGRHCYGDRSGNRQWPDAAGSQNQGLNSLLSPTGLNHSGIRGLEGGYTGLVMVNGGKWGETEDAHVREWDGYGLESIGVDSRGFDSMVFLTR